MLSESVVLCLLLVNLCNAPVCVRLRQVVTGLMIWGFLIMQIVPLSFSNTRDLLLERWIMDSHGWPQHNKQSWVISGSVSILVFLSRGKGGGGNSMLFASTPASDALEPKLKNFSYQPIATWFNRYTILRKIDVLHQSCMSSWMHQIGKLRQWRQLRCDV